MPCEAQQHSCVGTGFIVLDVVRNTVGTGATERRFAGGSCGNVLAILAYFGWAASAVGRIGNDQPGSELLADLAAWGVRTELLHVEPGIGTPIIVQENYLDSKARPRHRFSRVCPVCGASFPAYRPVRASEAASIAASLPQHSVFYLDRASPGTLMLAKRSRARGALVFFEPSGIGDEQLFREGLQTAHVVKYSKERLRGIGHIVEKHRVPIEIETLGASGLRMRFCAGVSRSSWRDFPAYSAPRLLDASGSGDWCSAGLIDVLMDLGMPCEQLADHPEVVADGLKFGQVLASLNCGFEGARGMMYAASSTQVRNSAKATIKGANESTASLLLTVDQDEGRWNSPGSWPAPSGEDVLIAVPPVWRCGKGDPSVALTAGGCQSRCRSNRPMR
ncbi:MAG: hypothetical protein KIS66_12520 [Fimbriimonadaceae bacterium]|nr:hypothetical protein [Fimbriimonadaceae bacterium]